MDTAPEDHARPGMLGHDLAAPCLGGCGWLETMCHCGLDTSVIMH